MKKYITIASSLLICIGLSGCSKADEKNNSNKDTVNGEVAKSATSQLQKDEMIAQADATPNRSQFHAVMPNELEYMAAKSALKFKQLAEPIWIHHAQQELSKIFLVLHPEETASKEFMDANSEENAVIREEKLEPYFNKLKNESANAKEITYIKAPIKAAQDGEREPFSYMIELTTDLYSHELKGFEVIHHSFTGSKPNGSISSVPVQHKPHKIFVIPVPEEKYKDIMRHSNIDVIGTAYLVARADSDRNSIGMVQYYPAYLDMVLVDRDTKEEFYKYSYERPTK